MRKMYAAQKANTADLEVCSLYSFLSIGPSLESLRVNISQWGLRILKLPPLGIPIQCPITYP